MKRKLAVTAVLFAVSALAPAQQTKIEKIERLMALTNSTATIDAVLGQIRNSFASQLPPNATPQQVAAVNAVTNKVADLVKDRIEKIRPDIAKIYADTYSDEEIDGVLAFYESPAGRALLQKSPSIVEKSMKLMQAQMIELQPEIQRIVRDTVPQR